MLTVTVSISVAIHALCRNVIVHLTDYSIKVWNCSQNYVYKTVSFYFQYPSLFYVFCLNSWFLPLHQVVHVESVCIIVQNSQQQQQKSAVQ